MESDGVWLLVCLVCGLLGFFAGKEVEKRGSGFLRLPEREFVPAGGEDEQPLKSYQLGDRKETEFLRDQLRKEREAQRKSEEQYKAEIKHLSAQVKELSKAKVTQQERLKRKEETRDLLNQLDEELQDRPSGYAASASIEDDIARELDS
jgi:flagellar motility protein MotE (MotC chaperone)